MKQLKFIFERRLTFETEVWQHYFSLKCLPQTTALQQISELSFEMTPCESISKTKDCFGNALYTGCIQKPHQSFYFCVKGLAKVKKGPLADERLVPLFKYASRYTQMVGKLRSYYETLKVPSFFNELSKALFLMTALNRQMHYEAGCTHVGTTAAEAFSLGKGVCQDYAHILLALCRAEHIPAKYVVGFIIGEGVTHAWVEVYCKGYWYGLDPTHDQEVDETYIKLAVGRDYADCNIDKGLFYGKTSQRQEIKVKVAESYD